MTDEYLVQSTADVLLAGFPREARRIAILLWDDCMTQGDSARADMWADVAHAIEQMTRRDRLN
ncbi:MAG: hypothetical protein WDM86_06305 [Rhizomicrobium sp.]